MSMKTVIATALGFYDGAMVQRGTIFDVPEKLTGKWFQPYTGQVLEEPAELAQEPTTLSELARKQVGAAPVAQVPARARVRKNGPVAQVPARAVASAAKTEAAKPKASAPPQPDKGAGSTASDQDVL